MEELIDIIKDMLEFAYRCFPPSVIYIIMPFASVGLFFKVWEKYTK